jgi:hypothetical protein
MRAELRSIAVACPSTVTVSLTPAGCSSRSKAELLPRSQRHVGEFERLEAAERGRDRVDRWLQIGDYVAPVRRRGDRAHVASFLILGRHGCPRHERAGLIEDRAREAGVAWAYEIPGTTSSIATAATKIICRDDR